MNEPLFINPFTDFGFKKIFGEEQKIHTRSRQRAERARRAPTGAEYGS